VTWLVAGVATLLIVGFFFASAPFRLLTRLFSRSIPKIASSIDRIAEDLEQRLAGSVARLEAMFWSLCYQVMAMIFFLYAARAFGAHDFVVALLVGVPLVHILSLAPISIGGFGVREGLFVAVLTPLGIAPDIALSLSILWLLASVFFALIGAAITLVETLVASKSSNASL
jgi:hypothetical protein